MQANDSFFPFLFRDHHPRVGRLLRVRVLQGQPEPALLHVRLRGPYPAQDPYLPGGVLAARGCVEAAEWLHQGDDRAGLPQGRWWWFEEAYAPLNIFYCGGLIKLEVDCWDDWLRLVWLELIWSYCWCGCWLSLFRFRARLLEASMLTLGLTWSCWTFICLSKLSRYSLLLTSTSFWYLSFWSWW